MQNLLLSIIVLFSSFSLFSQAEDQNFYLKDSKITWQKSYTTDKTEEEILSFFKNSSIFKKVKIENKQLIAELNNYATDPKKTGVAGLPEIVNKTDFKGVVIIQYRKKEKDYLVSFQEITLVGRGDVLKKKEENSFEEHFLRKDVSEYRPYFLKKPKKVYNITFSKIFAIQ